MTSTNTPGFNRRLQVFFSHDKHGRKTAFRWSPLQMRALRMKVADAEAFVAQDQADLLDGHPHKPR